MSRGHRPEPGEGRLAPWLGDRPGIGSRWVARIVGDVLGLRVVELRFVDLRHRNTVSLSLPCPVALLAQPIPDVLGRHDQISQTVVISADHAAGAASDFVEVYEAHYPRLVRALQIGGLDRASAEDVAQEAFARTLGHWRRVRLGTNPPGYAYRVGFRLARRTLRSEDSLLDETPGRGDVAGQVTARVAIEAVLAEMPPRRRSCAVLCLMSGVTTKDAARALGIAEGTVRKQLELARASLREALGDSAL